MQFEKQDMNEFIANCALRFCPECGREVKAEERAGRPRKFCSDACRRKFWKEHPQYEGWGSYEQLVCPVCGRVFPARHENTRKRKYCSRACANRARAMKGGTNEDSNT